MTKLTEKERIGFEKILEEDLKAIDKKFMNQIKDFWDIARQKIMEKRGWDKLTEEKETLEQQKQEIINRLHEIESSMHKENLRVEQIVELGGSTNKYGEGRDATFYGIPVTSQFDYEIVEFIRTNVDLKIPSKILRDICASSIRALAMAGTFEEARAAYEKFYSLDFRKYGVDIPPRLDDICNDKKLIECCQQPLQQIDDAREDRKQLKEIPESRPALTQPEDIVKERVFQ